MRTALRWIVPLVLVTLGPSLARADEGWVSLFNGKNLSGWDTHLQSQATNSDPSHIFQIEDGVLHLYKDHAAGSQADKGYFCSQTDYSHFHLRFQYKFGTKKFEPRNKMPRDAGFLYHLTGPDKVWPRCFECQVQQGDTGDCFTVQGTQITATINPKPARKGEYNYDPQSPEAPLGTDSNVRIIKQALYEVEGWNTVEVIVHGDQEVVYLVNGKEAFRGKNLKSLGADGKSWVPLSQGRIALQAECAEVYYRNIEVHALDSGPLHPPAAPPLVTVPPGFEITQVAGPPLVDYPVIACFDDEGRLYVSEGANYNDEYKKMAVDKPRSIRRLEDVDGDGVFDRYTLFADQMTFPYGGVFHDGALYVASDPSVWRLEDTDGDGVADKREEFLTGFTSGGHASCMKGGFLSPDGRLYFTGGNEGPYNITGSDGKNVSDQKTAPGVFRIRFDGRDLEYIANGAAGVYNLTFGPSGDIFGVVTILKYPRGDGLMHWIYGGAYISSHAPSYHTPLTGQLLQPLKMWEQTSPSGAAYYESGIFGDEYRGNVFGAHFSTRTVTRDALERNGATWRVTKEEDFAVGSETNCKFTDVIEDADGSLLLVNTGGWFRIGCPSAQVGTEALTGAIYRVRKKGQKKLDDPRGLKIAWPATTDGDLVKLLADERLYVRKRAIAELTRRGEKTIAAVKPALRDSSAERRRNAVWTLTRIDASAARAAVRQALSDADESVMLAAEHSAGLWRDQGAFANLIPLLKSEKPAVRGAAATALGRLGNPAAVPALLDALALPNTERFGQHTLIFALIELDARDATLPGLASANPQVARGALLALDGMQHGGLTEKDVAGPLASGDLPLQMSAIEVASRHRGWTKGILDLVGRWLSMAPLPDDHREAVLNALGAFRNDNGMRQLMGTALAKSSTPLATRELILSLMPQRKNRNLPPVWREPLKVCLNSTDSVLVQATLATLASFNAGPFAGELESLALDIARPMPVRVAAANVAVEGSNPPSDALLDLLIKQCLAPDSSAFQRLSISRSIGAARLSSAQLEKLTALVAVAGPLELPHLLLAYEDADPPCAGEALCAALLKAPGASQLSPLRLNRLLERYPQAIQEQGAPLRERFSGDAATMAARLTELKSALNGGEPSKGHDLFFGKASCSQCHKIGKEGAAVGPDLSEVGSSRPRSGLIEAVAFPSATFARGFEPVTVVNTSGQPISGIIRGLTPGAIEVLTPGRSSVFVPCNEVDEIVPSRMSVMPNGLDRNLDLDEFRDLIAFLTSLQKK